MADGSRERTRREVAKDILGLTWLGNASLEEYAVGRWFEEHAVQYAYQSPLDVMGRDIFLDFLILNAGFPLAIEVQGDRWHGGLEQVSQDRLRMLRALDIRPDLLIVEVWGHDIVEYPGWPVPTDAHFDWIMEGAMLGEPRSRPEF